MTRQQSHKLAKTLITVISALVVIPIVFVILFVFYNGVGALSWEFLTRRLPMA